MRATKVNAGLAESNGKLLLGIWRDSLHVTCGLTACTPGSALGPTLGNEYGKTLPFYWLLSAANTDIYIGLYEAISEWLEVVATVTLAVDERLLAPPGVDAARSAATTLR